MLVRGIYRRLVLSWQNSRGGGVGTYPISTRTSVKFAGELAWPNLDSCRNPSTLATTNATAKRLSKYYANCSFSWKEGKRSSSTACEMVSHEGGMREMMDSSAVTIVRYQPGQERFQLQLTLHNGKVFNFDRKCSDRVSSVLSRITTNISKKVKGFNGTVKFLLDNQSIENEEDDPEVEEILAAALKSGLASPASLKLRVGEDVYDVVFNPPEIHSLKFFSFYMPLFPLFPYRMETSGNWCGETSVYQWEFSRNPPSPVIPPKLWKNKAKNGPVKNNASEECENKRGFGSGSTWTKCGSSLVFTPEKDMEGGYLRFTVTPSNGSLLGKPFSVTLPNPVAALPIPIEKFLYQERLSRMRERREERDSLRVLTYNVLADTYATPEWFISSPKECLDAAYRLPILNRELQSYGADLICLQEVDEKYYQGNFEPFLNLVGYRGWHTSKTGNTKEGIATFYNPLKLTLVGSHECVILEHMKTLPLWERLKMVGNEFIQRLEERNTVFQISVLRANHCPNTLLLVGNVHLYFHPDADHIRLLQTITCIDFLESKLGELRQKLPEHKTVVLFCGDLNCTPPFSSYRLLTTGQLDENDEDWASHPEEKIVPGISVKHNLQLSNSHPEEELTNITTSFEGCLDYILFQPQHLQLVEKYPPPSKADLARLIGVDELRKVSLPNYYTPSDHLPVIADFKIIQ